MRYEPLPASFFQGNRARVAAALPLQAVAILHSNDPMPTNADGTMGFCQNSDLLYLTGVDEEDAILVLCPGARDPKRREILFVRETSELIAIGEGAKLSKEQARALTGAETVLWTSDFERVLREIMLDASAVYFNRNEHTRASNRFKPAMRVSSKSSKPSFRCITSNV